MHECTHTHTHVHMHTHAHIENLAQEGLIIQKTVKIKNKKAITVQDSDTYPQILRRLHHHGRDDFIKLCINGETQEVRITYLFVSVKEAQCSISRE